MDPKIALLFLLIGSVIGLSHLSDENLGRVRRQLASRALARIYARTAQSLGRHAAALRSPQFSAFFRRVTWLRQPSLAGLLVIECKGRIGRPAGRRPLSRPAPARGSPARLAAGAPAARAISPNAGCNVSKHFVQSIRSPNERKDAARLQKPCGGANPARQQPGRTHMCEAAARIGRDILASRIVEWWIHQDAIKRSRRSPTASSASGLSTSSSERSHPVVQPVEPRIAPSQARTAPHRSRPESPSVPGTRAASARPAAPTPAPRSIARSPARAPVAAASRIASWPTR